MPRNKIYKLSGFGLAIIILIVSLTSCGAPAVITQDPPAPPATEMDTVQEAWDIILKEYVEKDNLNTENMTAAAIKGMIEALNDPYTSYFDAKSYEQSRSAILGSFEGIGAYVGIKDKQLVIISPMPDSPAEKAGIIPGDIVTHVDGRPITGMSIEESILLIKGPKGTPVTLRVIRQNTAEPMDVQIIRDSIQIPSVQYKMMEEIAYLRIYSFSSHTDSETIEALKKAAEQNAQGIILDLRSNPGGLLDEVVGVASNFIKEGVIVTVIDNKGNKEPSSVLPRRTPTNLPMIVLSDNFSASGSEVLMGALQDHGRAKVAGAQTYGKGSVNSFFKLSDGSGIYITISRWMTPNGRLIEGKGLEPDIEIDPFGEDTIQWAIDYLRQLRNNTR